MKSHFDILFIRVVFLAFGLTAHASPYLCAICGKIDPAGGKFITRAFPIEHGQNCT
ncbi:hypothetical protein ES707_08151 [subsurface metagenome]